MDTVVEARDRVGGRVWTLRDGFASGQHAEAGGDIIDQFAETLCGGSDTKYMFKGKCLSMEIGRAHV